MKISSIKSILAVIAVVSSLALQPMAANADSGVDHQAVQARPIALGTSGGNIQDRSNLYCCSGTLGALVEDSIGTQYILSNNHVLAGANLAAIGDDVNQPGMIDQNCAQTGIVADLSDFVEIKFRHRGSRPANAVDAAIAEVRSGQVQTDGTILDIGVISAQTLTPTVGLAVQKSGRTTGHTTGVISAVNVTVDVGYSTECGGSSNQVARFTNQFRVTDGTFSAGGDSGSLILESSVSGPPRAVGLLFAGSSSSTIANPIDAVLNAFNVTLVSGTPPPPGPEGSISGTVSDASGNPLSGASMSTDTGQQTTTDGTGAFSLTGVPVGSRNVTAEAAGHDAATQNVDVFENADSVVNFSLSQTITPAGSSVACIIYNTEGGKNGDKHILITVRVVDDTGAPLANAQVDIDVTRDNTGIGGGSALTNGSGEVTFTSKNARNGIYETTVTNVTAAGISFDGNTPANAFNKGVDAVPASYCASGSGAADSVGADIAKRVANVRSVKSRHSDDLFAIRGVVGHGVGLSASGEAVIELYLENGNALANVPEHVENIPVRAIVTGAFSAL